MEASTESGSGRDPDRVLTRGTSAGLSIGANVGGGVVLLLLATLAFWPVVRSFTARLILKSRSRVELLVELPSNGILVLYNSFERGWSATLNGKSAPVLRADGAFLGLRLPPGTHRVNFDYSPRGLALAAIRLPPGAPERTP